MTSVLGQDDSDEDSDKDTPGPDEQLASDSVESTPQRDDGGIPALGEEYYDEGTPVPNKKVALDSADLAPQRDGDGIPENHVFHTPQQGPAWPDREDSETECNNHDNMTADIGRGLASPDLGIGAYADVTNAASILGSAPMSIVSDDSIQQPFHEFGRGSTSPEFTAQSRPSASQRSRSPISPSPSGIGSKRPRSEFFDASDGNNNKINEETRQSVSKGEEEVLLKKQKTASFSPEIAPLPPHASADDSTPGPTSIQAVCKVVLVPQGQHHEPEVYNRSTHPLLVPHGESQRRMGSSTSRLHDDDIEWALNMFVCCRTDARYGDSRAPNSKVGSQSFAPSLDTQHVEGNCLWVCLPRHSSDHWSAIFAAITQDAGWSSGACTTITSVKTLNSLESGNQQALQAMEQLIKAQTNGGVASLPPQDGSSLVSTLPCTLQSPESVSCGIHVIVNTLRFLYDSTTIDVTATQSVNEGLWRGLLPLMGLACSRFDKTSENLEDEFVSSLSDITLIVDTPTALGTSKELAAANETFERAQSHLQSLSKNHHNHLLEASKARRDLRDAMLGVDRAELHLAETRLSQLKSLSQEVQEVHDILSWAQKSANDEVARLENETLPKIRDDKEKRSRGRDILREYATPVTHLPHAMWEKEDQYVRKQIRFYERRILEAKRTAVVALALKAAVVERELKRVVDAQEELMVLQGNLKESLGESMLPN